MFFIFESAILLFPKHSYFRVFWCNSRRNHANRQNKTSEDLWRPWEDERTNIQQASEDVTKGRTMFPSFKTSYMEANTQKDEEIGVLGTTWYSHKPDTQLCEPRHMSRRLAHGCRRMEPETSLTCACRMVLGAWHLFLASQGVILWLFGGKGLVF